MTHRNGARRGAMVIVCLLAGCHRGPAPETSRAMAAPAIDRCAVALAAGPAERESDRQVGRMQQEARGPRARPALERLGYLYVSRARVRNDPGDYRLAEATADCLDARFPGEPATLLLRGHVLHQLHRFREAEQIARTLIARRDVVLDHGLLGDVLMEQGRLPEAAAAYQRMLDLKPFYQSYTRAAHLRWLKGDLDGAIAALRLAIETASPRDPESSAWAWTRLAGYELQAGRIRQSMSAAATALQHQPDYAAALLAQGRTLLAMQRAGEAIDPLRRASDLNPLPEYQWALADALRLGGRPEDAAAVEHDLVSRGAAADRRTVALYLATRRTDPARSLALAEEELDTRADIFTLDAHAWALAASGRYREAHDTMQRAVAEGTEDARLFLHAGVIAAAAGHPREARRWLRKADGLKATLLPSEAATLAASMNRRTE